MGRPSKHAQASLLDAARALVVEGGPAALTLSAVARHAGAPSGSVYHRFSSRDVLAAELWLRTVERFQAGFIDALANEPLAAALAAALHVVSWSRSNLEDAQLLALVRGSDLGRGSAEQQTRKREMDARGAKALAGLQKALGCRSAETRHRVLFAVVEAPLAAVKPFLRRGVAPPRHVDLLVEDTVRLLVGPLAKPLANPRRE